MTRSLNELKALSRRAARGAGFSYGQAEDAAFAVHWLCERGYPGAAALRECLECREAGTCDGGGGTCGLCAGAACLDAHLAEATLTGLNAPLLALPFLSILAESNGTGLGCAIAGKGLSGLERLGAIESGQDIRLAPFAETALPAASPGARATVTDEDLAVLMAFAARTYAPATEASRLSGAGAGLNDND